MESLYILGYTQFLQTGIIDDTEDQEDLLDNSHAQYFPSLTESDPWRTLTTTLAHLYCLGLDVDWSGFEQGYSRRKVLLPTYPFQRSYFWCETIMEHLVPQRKTEKRPEERPMGFPFDGKITSSPIKTKQIEYSLSLDVVPDVKAVSGL